MQRTCSSALALSLLFLATVGGAQTDNRAERWRDDCERGWNSDRAHFCELRTYYHVSVDENFGRWRSQWRRLVHRLRPA